MVMGLLSVAATWWTRNAEDAVSVPHVSTFDGVSVPVSYDSFDGIGCSNWQEIQLFRKVVADRERCAELCNANSECTAFNWQATECDSPRSWKANGCLLFKGQCAREENSCWQLNTKIADEPCISELDMNRTIEAFYGAVVAIGMVSQDCSAAKEAAMGALDAAYAYNVPGVTVQFKPTLTELPWIFRPTQPLALSYFVGKCVCPGATTAAETLPCSEADGYYAPDFGFALGPEEQGWEKVAPGTNLWAGQGMGGNPDTNFWYNMDGPFCHAATAQGPVCFTPRADGNLSCVDKTFGFVLNPDRAKEGALRVLLSTHHSSTHVMPGEDPVC
jgi:hypothetical protein